MPWGPTCAGECVSISCRNSEARTTGEDRTTERRQPRRRPRTIMRIQVARTHSYALVRVSLLVLSLSLFLSFHRGFLPFNLIPRFSASAPSPLFYLARANPAALDFASTSSSALSSRFSPPSSSCSPLPSPPPSAPSRGYVQARCIPEPREWKDLVKVSRSLGAYA